eukprot:15361818-Ditylum_brightwellii.AAC.1
MFVIDETPKEEDPPIVAVYGTTYQEPVPLAVKKPNDVILDQDNLQNGTIKLLSDNLFPQL